jgi:Rad3-related DNA helicase
MMTNPKNDLSENIPSNFSFPYKPYQIQIDFMRELYRTLESYKVGIFESPTGTVKKQLFASLFIIRIKFSLESHPILGKVVEYHL